MDQELGIGKWEKSVVLDPGTVNVEIMVVDTEAEGHVF